MRGGITRSSIEWTVALMALLGGCRNAAYLIRKQTCRLFFGEGDSSLRSMTAHRAPCRKPQRWTLA